MEKSVYCTGAQIVGWLDLFMFIMYAVWYAIVMTMLAPMTSHFLIHADREPEDLFNIRVHNVSVPGGEKSVLVYFWVAAMVDCVLTLIQIVAAVLLLFSTNLTNPITCKKLTIFWLGVNITVFMEYVVWRIIERRWITVALGLFRFVAIGIVIKYFLEIRQLIKNTPGITRFARKPRRVTVLEVSDGDL